MKLISGNMRSERGIKKRKQLPLCCLQTLNVNPQAPPKEHTS